MSNIAKLKKKAAELETRKQYEKAVEVYEQVLNTARSSDEERDVALYNRVGDLHYRIGNNERAIAYYEQAADFYAEGGFFNNAIALCNKILRYSPGRTIIYYKLGIISAKKGFNSDAKQNFLEYADRMQRLGKMDEAFRAMKEFADLCPGQDDVRLMLSDQLARANRKEEALEQLELLYDTLMTEGRTSEATAALERIKALDPTLNPRRSITPRARTNEGLIFHNLEFESPSEVEGLGDEESEVPGDEKPETRRDEEFTLTGVDVFSGASMSRDVDALEGDDVDDELSSDFIDLGEWLERTRTPSSTRMITHDEEQENSGQKDFGEMLDRFKAGISRNVDDGDFDSHYDLGIAFREMGLLDEAIGSFQKASRGKALRLRASESIGQCFLDKGDAGVTMTVLEHLVTDPDMSDSQLVGMLYLLGCAAMSLGRPADAAGYFQRVLAVQIGFRDAADRLASLAQTSR